jgi:hypothetical protein
MSTRHAIGLAVGIVCAAPSFALADPLLVNAPQQIRQAVQVNVIRVADDAGGQAAPTFGTAAQQATILAGVDTVFAQAGIDVQFKFRTGTWNNSFTLGTPGSTTARSSSDLNQAFSLAASAGVLDPDPLVLNLLQVRVVPAFAQTTDNTSNGYAFLDASGICFWTGPNLPTFANGQVLVSKVLSHEIGHNLNLPHLSESGNLMQPSTGNYFDAQLNSSQVSTVKQSRFARVIGDANGNRTCNFDDLLILAANYNITTGRSWATGDFNFDGATNFDDLLLLAANYNYTMPGTLGGGLEGGGIGLPDEQHDLDGISFTLASASVPEPTSFVLLAGSIAFLGRPRRRLHV